MIKYIHLKRILKNSITLGLLGGIVLSLAFLIFNMFFSDAPNYSADLTIYDSKLKKVKSEFKVAISDTDKKRKLGLMFIKNMPDNNGMLFVFDSPHVVSFWMKNTYISLDLLFVDENKKIVSLFEKTTPLSENSIFSTQPVKYVVELNAGIVSDYQIKTGDIIEVNYNEIVSK